MNVVLQEKVSKMSIAKKIFEEIHQSDYKLPEGKQIRGHFMDRCVQELGLKEKAAGTYYVNIRNFVKGGSLYYKAKKKETTVVDVSEHVKVDNKDEIVPEQVQQGRKKKAA